MFVDITPWPCLEQDVCFACGYKIGRLAKPPKQVDTRDGQLVYVGPNCFRKIADAGEAGWQPPKGGPRLWLLAAAPKREKE